MIYPKPTVLCIQNSNSSQRGQEHGETLREHVQAMAKIRIDLMCSETDYRTEQEVLQLARRHLPFLESYDVDLYDELVGIAVGSNLTPEHIVVLNHYTDMRDIKGDSGGCSSVYLPPPGGPVLGQTWDIHASAMEHVVILDLGETLIFSVAGCLGMTGMNQYSVGVTVNNLTSLDARVGVVWPAVVRKALKQSSAEKAKESIWQTRLGSGHHYLVADQQDAFGIETSGTKKKITQQGGSQIHFHTNHCLDQEMACTATIKSTSTTHARYNTLEQLLKNPPTSATDLYETLGHVSIAPTTSDLTATCGAFVMDLTQKRALTCVGPASQTIFHNPPLCLDMSL